MISFMERCRIRQKMTSFTSSYRLNQKEREFDFLKNYKFFDTKNI